MNILITGGARRIGAAIVRHLAGAGHGVAIHHHKSADEAEALRDAIVAAGGRAATVCADLGDADAVRGLIDAARAGLGGAVTGLVNNASLFAYDEIPLADYACLDRHMHVNLGAPLVLASALAGQADVEDAAIVNLLDQKVANLNPDFLSYTCSKLALSGATRLLAQALAPKVRVNAVSPGLTLPSLDQTEAEFAAAARENLLRHPVDLGELAATVEHLLTSRSITGQNVYVDCGQRFMPRDEDVMYAVRDQKHG